MREDYTHITLVVDRSGSMRSLQQEAEGGINALISEQFELDGKLTVTLAQFDDSFDTVERMATEKFTYYLIPRGMTALYDAVGREIAKTGEDLANLAEDERPSKVLFVIVTDGQENASQEYDVDQIKKRVEHQQDVYNWEFQFIGVDQAAWQGRDLGMQTYSYSNTSAGTTSMYQTLSNSTSMYRSAVDASFVMDPADTNA